MLIDLPTNRKPRVHFSGIGGVAMVAGARLALEAGWEVRGSDNPLYPPASHMVEELGVPVASGYAAENLDWDPDLVIIGNVLSRGNAEVEAVLERRMRYTSLPEWIKEFVLRKRRPAAICGTHGKTTTTALAAWYLDRAGLKPGFLIGGETRDFPHSARLGQEGAPFVIEGDEYDTAFFDKRAKFLHYIPECAVVTSIEFDHGDIYRDLDEINVAFQRMLRQIPRSGKLILCADDAGAMALAQHAPCAVETYGFGNESEWRGSILEPESKGRPVMLNISYKGNPWAQLPAPLPGKHNLQNALAAIAVAAHFGVTPQQLENISSTYVGVRRRMEIFRVSSGVTFVDDFAHHPTAIRETIAAARMKWPDNRLWAIFEPRSNTTVTNRYQKEITDALATANVVWMGPIYRGDSIPKETRLNRNAICENLSLRGVAAAWTDSVGTIVNALVANVAENDVVVFMSNGAFGGIYDKIREAFPADDE